MPCGLKDLVIKLIIKPCGFKMCPHEKKKKESALENDYVYVCMYVCWESFKCFRIIETEEP